MSLSHRSPPQRAPEKRRRFWPGLDPTGAAPPVALYHVDSHIPPPFPETLAFQPGAPGLCLDAKAQALLGRAVRMNGPGWKPSFFYAMASQALPGEVWALVEALGREPFMAFLPPRQLELLGNDLPCSASWQFELLPGVDPAGPLGENYESDCEAVAPFEGDEDDLRAKRSTWKVRPATLGALISTAQERWTSRDGSEGAEGALGGGSERKPKHYLEWLSRAGGAPPALEAAWQAFATLVAAAPGAGLMQLLYELHERRARELLFQLPPEAIALVARWLQRELGLDAENRVILRAGAGIDANLCRLFLREQDARLATLSALAAAAAEADAASIICGCRRAWMAAALRAARAPRAPRR